MKKKLDLTQFTRIKTYIVFIFTLGSILIFLPSLSYVHILSEMLG